MLNPFLIKNQSRNDATPQHVAMGGYDPVAYFTEEDPVLGSELYEYHIHDRTWRFATAANRELFIQNPEKFMPQYGGHCAFGISLGKRFAGNPKAWTVVNGKLYLHLTRDIARIWTRDIPGNIGKADKRWGQFKS